MTSFTNDLIVTSYLSYKWELFEEFYFYFNEEDKELGVTVPTGFITDFASVPRILWAIIAPTGRHTKAAVLHDYLYSTSSTLNFTRKHCDKLFLEAMKILGVKKWKRVLMYRGVRLFGGKYYKQNQ